jgi:hypothetical protein
VLTLLTIEGNRSRWVNQEIGYAEGKGKIIIPIVEVGVKVTGFLEGREYISFKRNEPDSAVTKAMQFLKNMASKKEQDTLIGGAILAGLILLFGLLALGALKSGKS